MHEYRASGKELDGTHPGQGAFVLCRLFKKHDEKCGEKQDEKTEGSNCDEEENVSSPATVKLLAEDTQSEPVTPLLSGQAEKQPSSIDSCFAENSDRATLDTPLPSSSYNFDQVLDITSIPPDPELEEMLKVFGDPMPGPPDGKISSPLHLQMPVELGSSYLHYPLTNDISSERKGVQFQYSTNEQDVTEFLNSVLIDSDEDCGSHKNLTVESEPPIYVHLQGGDVVKDSGSCNESDAEGFQAQSAQAQFDPAFAGSWWFEQNFGTETPLLVETSPGAWVTPDISNDEHQRNLGFLQLQNDSLGQDAFSVGSVGSQYNNLFNSLEESSSCSNAVGSGDIFGTGIRIRTQQPRNPSAQNFATQGTTPRRIRLQKKKVGSVFCSNLQDYSYSEENHEAKPTVIEAKHTCATVGTATTIDETQEISLSKNMRSISLSVYMLRVIVVLGLFIMFIGLWRCLKIEVA
uniref:Putative NAC domain-containing protein 45 n=1 Tax=Davidia involucrata TaxID=16924 RepID=A0A5B7AGQ1_DAVIN